MAQRSVNELMALLPLLIQIVGLLFAVLVDSYLDRRQKRVMLAVAALAFALVVENYTEYLLCMRASLWYPRLIAAIIGYAIRPVILALFCHIVSPRRSHWGGCRGAERGDPRHGAVFRYLLYDQHGESLPGRAAYLCM